MSSASILFASTRFTWDESTGWGFPVGWRWIFHARAEHLPGVFSLPADGYSLSHGMVYGDGPWTAALLDTTAAKPALIGI